MMKERIMKMIEQYSITKDNPTVLRELLKLSAIVETMVNYSEELEAKVNDLESKINDLDPGQVSEMVQAIQESVNRALELAGTAETKADSALSGIEGAVAKSDQALQAAEAAEAKAGAASSKADAASLQSAKASQDAVLASAKADTATSGLAVLRSDVESLSSSLTEQSEEIGRKQDKLTFDNAPKAGSLNPVTSDGVKKAIDAIPSGGSVVLDDEVTEESSNGVKSSGIYSAIQAAKTALETLISAADTKAGEASSKAETAETTAAEALADAAKALEKAGNALTYNDVTEFATDHGVQPISSGGVFNEVIDLISRIQRKQDALTFDNTPKAGSLNPVTSGGVFNAIKTVSDTVTPLGEQVTALEEFKETQDATNETHNTQINANIKSIQGLQTGKQDVLTFDETPTEGSSNPVTSGGVYSALQNGSGSGILFSYARVTKSIEADALLDICLSVTMTINNILYSVIIPVNIYNSGSLSCGYNGIITNYSEEYFPYVRVFVGKNAITVSNEVDSNGNPYFVYTLNAQAKIIAEYYDSTEGWIHDASAFLFAFYGTRVIRN